MRETNLCGHGGKGTRIYRIWMKMRRRCSDPSEDNYLRYGGRGITVCDEWRDSFAAFRDWAIANGYADDLTIDRIDNDGNYEPSNCRWATRKTQQNNTRRNHYITANGLTLTVAEWSERTGIKYDTLQTRLKKGWNPEKAVSTPARRYGEEVKK